MSNNAAATTGVPFVDLLALAFIVLKLTGVISWPWLWVLAPIWGGAAVLLLVLLGILVVAGVRR